MALNMLSVSVVLVLVMAAMVSAAPASDKPYYDIDDAEALFEEFIKKYNRKYKDDADRAVHYQAFVEHLKEINMFNSMDSTATHGINKFADITKEEERYLFGLIPGH